MWCLAVHIDDSLALITACTVHAHSSQSLPYTKELSLSSKLTQRQSVQVLVSLPPPTFPFFFLLLDSGTAALDSRAEPSEMAVPGSRQKMAQRLPQECSNFSWRLFRDDWTEKGHKDAGLYPMTRRVVQGRQY